MACLRIQVRIGNQPSTDDNTTKNVMQLQTVANYYSDENIRTMFAAQKNKKRY